MASLMENLISILQEECDAYDKLLKFSMDKTPVIVSEDLKELERITDEEQTVVSDINRIDKKREQVTKDIADVMNMDVHKLKLKTIIQLMAKRPEEQEALEKSYDRLHQSVHQVENINRENAELIKSALDMVHFNMQLIQSAKTAPENANYNRIARNTGEALGTEDHLFDAKQ